MKVVDFFHFPIATAEEERLFKLTVSEMKKYLSQLENKNVNKYVILYLFNLLQIFLVG